QIAITKVGAAWLPFDADAPMERIALCLRDSEAKGLITSEPFAVKADGLMPCPVFTGRTLDDPHDTTLIDVRSLGATPDDPAYLIYTSGSTGTPKGIVITQRNICHSLRAMNDVYGFRTDDIVFQNVSLAFDLSLEEVWIPYL